MDVAAAQALYDQLHEERPFHDGTFKRWTKTRSLIFRYHYNDGVTIGVADEDLTPGDEFTTKVNASPVLLGVDLVRPDAEDERGRQD